MYGVSQRQRKNKITDDSEDSIDLRDAEYKSLADLDDESDDTDDMGGNCNRKQCRICPLPPKRLQQTANINVGYPSKVNEGDTSIEESCIDLNSDRSRVTVKTETKYKENTKGQKVVTNVNVTTFRPQKYRRDPSEAVYSVVSSRGSELHLRRKPMIVRPSDPSREQACMFLNRRSSTYPTYSAPSLTGTGGNITSKKNKSTDVSNRPIKHMSSEIAVFYRDSEIWESKDQSDNVAGFRNNPPNTLNNEEYYEDNNFEERTRKTNHSRRVNTQVYNLFTENPSNDQIVQTSNNVPYMNKIPADNMIKNRSARPKEKDSDENDFYIEEVEDTLYNEENSIYVFLKRNEKTDKFSKDGKPTPTNYDIKLNNHSKGDLVKYNNANPSRDMRQYIDKQKRNETLNTDVINKTNLRNVEINSKDPAENYTSNNRKDQAELLQQFSQDEIFTSSEYKEKSQRKVIFKEENNVATYPLSRSNEKNKENNSRINDKHLKEKDNRIGKTDTSSDVPYEVRLSVRATISDHRKPGKKSKQFYVTKISPVETGSYITPINSRANRCFGNDKEIGEYYYAKPLIEHEDAFPEKDEYSSKQTDDTQTQGKNIKLEIDQKPNLPQLNQTCNILPQTVQTFPNKYDDYTYQYEEEYEENELQEFKNETLYKRTKSIQPPQPKHVSKQIEAKDCPRKIAAVKPENKMLKHNENIDTVVQLEENIASKSKFTEKTNTYQSQDDPDIRIVDKTITGKIGETKSTDVFIKRRTTEMLKPEKTDVSEDVDYSLVRTKNPKPQQYIKEPLTKSQPRTIITQNLSLDQKIIGHSQVRQTVEYHNEKVCNKTDLTSPVPEEVKKETVSPTIEVNENNVTTEISEEESVKQFITVKKSQNFIANIQPSTQQETKRRSSEMRAILSKSHTNVEIKPLKNIDNNYDQSTILEEYYSDKKSSTVIKSYQRTRTGYSTNKLYSKSKNTVEEGNISVIPANNTNIMSGINQETDDTIKKKIELTVPSANNVIVKLNPAITHEKESEIGNLSYEHEETSHVNKSFKHRTKLEKIVITREQENERTADNTPTTQQQKPSPQKNMECKEDQNKYKEKTTLAKTQQSRDKEPRQAKDNIYEDKTSYEEVTEKSVSGYTSQKTKKTITVQRKGGDPSYKIPTQTSGAASTPDTNHIIPIKKVEIPEPHYITRIPKQPLVVFEAYPVDPRQPFEIVTETIEEMASTVKTNKTFMMFKRINGKAILNQPSVIEPMQMERSHEFNNQYSDSTHSGNVSKDQTGVERNRENPENSGENIQKSPQNEVNNSTPTSNHTIFTARDNDDSFTEYELSETNVLSQHKSVHKGKRYKLTVRQSPVNKENNESISRPRKQPLTEDSPENNIKAEDHPLVGIDQTKTDGGMINDQTLDLNKTVTDTNTKIQQVNVAENPDSSVNNEVVMTVLEKLDDSCRVPVKAEPVIPRQRPYTNEEFYESTTREEKYESSEKRYVSMRGNTRIVNTRPCKMLDQGSTPQLIRNAGKDLKYPEDVPTRDLNMQKSDLRPEVPLGKISESSSERQDNKITKNTENNNQNAKNSLPSSKGQRNPTTLDQNTIVKSEQGNKNDGDIVIFIRQPRAKNEQVTPKITVDVTEKQFMTSSELDDQKVQVHEIKDKTNRNASKKPTVPRKSKSTGNYPSFSSSGKFPV